MRAGLVIERLKFAVTRQKNPANGNEPATNGERSAGCFWGSGSGSQESWRAFPRDWRRITRRDRRVGCSERTLRSYGSAYYPYL